MFSGFGVIWRKVVIVVHFGDKIIKTYSLPLNSPAVDD